MLDVVVVHFSPTCFFIHISFFPLTTTGLFKFSLSFQNFIQKIMTSEAVEEALSQLSNEQIEQFRKYFNMFDKEKKGYIHTSQVGQILRTMGQAFEDRDLKQLIKEFDTDGSGEIEFEEFAALVARFVMQEDDSANMEEELREAFRLYDKEGNGYINVSDLRDILRALDENITEDELDEMIAEIDTDGSGTVDFDEFMEMMSGGD
ncbi:Troponin C, isoform 2 [Trichinella papuae]|uniref:Troponin C, isoform 2 n=1 Tax=Trichinella papuae TaxID=268474 RepID=A0A0V1MVU7_9BILA|nr:Troponin C, isoform 2 [Trichinella papuae]